MERICPNCKVVLVRKSYDGANLAVCPDCAGIWFDPGELGTLIHHDPRTMLGIEADNLPHPQLHTPAMARLCPACAAAMQPYRYEHASPILLDSCPECWGIWVDDGELQKIQDWRTTDHLAAMPADARAASALALANLEVEHQREMQRLDNIRTIASVFGRRHPFGRLLGW